MREEDEEEEEAAKKRDGIAVRAKGIQTNIHTYTSGTKDEGGDAVVFCRHHHHHHSQPREEL